MWSPLEYGCHVRDVFELFEQRLTLMLTEDDPQFANWNQDVTAVTDRYGEQDPVAVAGELAVAADAIARAFAAVDGDQWDRPGRRSDGARFTVRTFGQYFCTIPSITCGTCRSTASPSVHPRRSRSAAVERAVTPDERALEKIQVRAS